jgi:hypothetical protein
MQANTLGSGECVGSAQYLAQVPRDGSLCAGEDGATLAVFYREAVDQMLDFKPKLAVMVRVDSTSALYPYSKSAHTHLRIYRA